MNSVLLDVTRAKNPWSGLGQFAIHLAEAIAANNSSDIVPTLYLNKGDEDKFSCESCENVHAQAWHKENFRPITSRLPGVGSSLSRYSLWHTFDQLSSYAPLNRKTPILLTIHDLNFPDRSDSSSARGLRTVQKRVDRAAAIATISKYSAREIHRLLNLGNKKVHVIPLGHCLNDDVAACQPAMIKDSPFLFSIGEFRTTKNFHLLVSLVEQLPDYHLIIAGNFQTDYGQDVIAQAKESPASSRIHLPGKVSDGERRWLYENCAALLFPSVAEGFGLPVLEAMSCGRPVFTTKEMSLPEVAGDCGIYWNTLEPKEMLRVFREGMEKFAATPDSSMKLIEHAKKFDWKLAAQAYIELYQKILQ